MYTTCHYLWCDGEDRACIDGGFNGHRWFTLFVVGHYSEIPERMRYSISERTNGYSWVNMR